MAAQLAALVASHLLVVLRSVDAVLHLVQCRAHRCHARCHVQCHALHPVLRRQSFNKYHAQYLFLFLNLALYLYPNRVPYLCLNRVPFQFLYANAFLYRK